MKRIIRIKINNGNEEKVIKKALRGSGFRIIKGFKSLIVPIEGGTKKGNNKYKKMLLAMLALQTIGFKHRAKIVSLGVWDGLPRLDRQLIKKQKTINIVSCLS